MMEEDDGKNIGGEGKQGNEDKKENEDKNKNDEGKTFTQAELNDMIEKTKKSVQESILKGLGISDFKNAKDGLAKYKEWAESQKTEAQKIEEEKQRLAEESKNISSKMREFEIKNAVLSSGVKPNLVEKVVKLVKAEGEEDFNKSLENILKEFPEFKDEKEEKNINLGNKNKGNKADDERFLAMLKRAKGR